MANMVKYWVRAEVGISEAPGEPPVSKMMVSMGIVRPEPVSEFEHIGELSAVVANQVGSDLKAIVGTVTAQIVSWQRLEERSALILPTAKMIS